MKEIIICILLVLLPLLSAPAIAIASAEFEDIPDYILLRSLFPHLKAIDLFRLDQVSSRYHQVMQNDNAWKSVVGRHTPAPITEWLVGQYKYAVKCMLNNKTYFEFPKSAQGEAFDRIDAINWSGSVIGGAAIPLSEKNSNSPTFSACIFTEQQGMQFLKNLEGGINSRIRAVNHNGSIAVGSIEFGELYDKAFVWNQQDGMQAIWPIDDDIDSYATHTDWSGKTVAGKYANKPFIKTSAEIIHPITDSKENYYVKVMSGDGTTVIGTVNFIGPGARMFKWTPTNTVEIFNNMNVLSIVSANWDMSMAIILHTNHQFNLEAVMWTETAGFQSLNFFDGVYDNVRYTSYEYLTLSSDGQIVVGYVVYRAYRHSYKKNDLMLYNLVLDKYLSFRNLFDPTLSNNFRFVSCGRQELCTNFWGNVILGNGFIENHDGVEKNIGWRAFIPRYDILDDEEIAYIQPRWKDKIALKISQF